MKKRLRIISIALLLILTAAAAGLLVAFRTELATIRSIEPLSGGKALYAMTYAGDHGFDDFLAAGGAASSDELSLYLSRTLSKGLYTHIIRPLEHGCSTISAATRDGGFLFGRNFDWRDCTCMIVLTRPDEGYRSISTVNLSFLGFSEASPPDRFPGAFLALAAAYIPVDGMNEAGLCVADLIISGAGETHQDTGKADLTTTTAIRLVLDRAATVDEAVALLSQYDMHSDIGTMHHFAISDAEGNAVVVEYIDDVMHVTQASVVTNHFLSPAYDGNAPQNDSSLARYEALRAAFGAHHGVMDGDAVEAVLMAAARSGESDGQWNTQWSIVFDQEALSATYYHREDFGVPYVFSLP